MNGSDPFGPGGAERPGRPTYRRLPAWYAGRSRPVLWAGGTFNDLRSRAWRRNPSPPTRFVVFSEPRSGSTLLTTLLDSHPQIGCPGEILRYPSRDPLRFVADSARRRAVPCFGFHVIPSQLKMLQGFDDPPAFLDALIERGWRLIHLVRRDTLAQILSIMRAQESGLWHLRSGKSAGGVQPIEVDAEKLARRISKTRARLARTRDRLARHDPFELIYEDDLADPETRHARLAGLQSWLGVAPAPLTSELRKISGRDPLEGVANRAEVERALSEAGLTERLAPRK